MMVFLCVAAIALPWMAFRLYDDSDVADLIAKALPARRASPGPETPHE